jgi:hypothetical protein
VSDDRVIIHLAAESRLLRVGPSMVIVAEPHEGGDGQSPSIMRSGGSISCVCPNSEGGGCKIVITVDGPRTVTVRCVSDGCKAGCSRWIVDDAGLHGIWLSSFRGRL